jgi:hypothetical protein
MSHFKSFKGVKDKPHHAIREYVWYLTNQENDNKSILTNFALLNVEERLLFSKFL